jgi:C4-dicarboxylate-specific signal transduction histidine kinase
MALSDVVSSSDLGPESVDRLDQLRREAAWVAELLGSADSGPDGTRVVDLGEAVADAWSGVASCALCSLRLVRDANAQVLADPVELRRSVRNLIENAARAVGPGGRLEVRVIRRRDEVVLEVADSGPGFGGVARQEGLGLETVEQFVKRNAGILFMGTSELGGALVGFRLRAVNGHSSRGVSGCGS